MCTDVGYFPSPSICTKYYFCNWKVGVDEFESFEYNCPAGFVTNMATPGLCLRSTRAADCIVLNCANSAGRLIAYTGSRTYYAFCLTTSSETALIMACPVNTSVDLTARPDPCIYNCVREGLFPNSADDTTYYQCTFVTGSSTRFTSTLQNCPPRSTFSTVTSRCVADPTIPPTP